MKLTLKEAIQSRKLKLIASELESLARQDRGVKKIVDELKKGKEPNPNDITSLKGDTQDEVVMAFASVIGPSKTSDYLGEEKGPCWDGYKQVGTKKGRKGNQVPNCVPEGKEDSEIGDREGSQPASYHKGLAKSTKEKRDAQFKKQAKMDDDNPDAYKPAPGDKSAETKPSKYSKKYDKMFGEQVEELEESNVKKSLENKSKETGVAYGILKSVYDRGVAAWRTGHRPGTTPTQWGLARVNSFVTGGKTQKTADKDLWAKHKGKNEEFELDEAVRVDTQRYVRSNKKEPSGRGRWLFTTKPMGTPKDDEVFSMSGIADYKQATKKAQDWAKKKGSSAVYVMESVDLEEGVYIEFKDQSAKEKWMKQNNIKSNDSDLVHLSKTDVVVKSSLEKYADANKFRNLISKTDTYKMRLSAFIDKYRKSMKKEEVELDEAKANYIRLDFNSVTDRQNAEKWMFDNLPSRNQGFTGMSGKLRNMELEGVNDADQLMRKLKAAGFKFKVGIRESVSEAKISVGDSVRVKDKPANVVDRQFFGMAGVISGKAGKDFMVKFPNKRSIVVDAKDLEVMNEAYDAPDYGPAGASDMALTQLHFIEYAAEEVRDCLDAGAIMEEWYQNKLAKIHGEMEGLHSHMEGQKRRLEMCMGDMEVDSEEDIMSRYMYSEANHSPMHVNKAIRIAKDMGGNMTGAYEKIEKMSKGLSKHPKVKAALRMANEETDLTERVVKKYNVGPKDEVAKVYKGGPRKNVTVRIIKKHRGDYEVFIGGGPWYHDTYKTLKASEQGVEKYLKSLDEGYEKHPNFVTEKAESQAQAIAARIALKHKREGTQPEKGSASAEMMKMSEKDLEDFTKAKKGAPEKVEESVELHENFIRNLRQVAQRLGLRDIAWKLLQMEKDKAAEKITQSDINGFVKDAEEAYPMISKNYQRYYKGLVNKLKKAKGREALDMMQEIARYISKIQSTAKMRNEEVELTESHYKVGQRVTCIESGMKGTVVHVDPSDEGKYYTVKRDDGKKMKYAPNELKPMGEVKEAKMEDSEVLAAAKKLASNGKDEKAKSFGKGLVDFYEKNKSFTPDQVAGLQNIMKNASFQMAEAMDPVNKAALKKKFKNRKDKDIDNDGDVDDSDEYLHNRRKAITKAVAKEEKMDPVDKAALKKKFKNRKDKDINNDGKVDDTDEYLHKRRSAISKAIAKEQSETKLKEKDVDMDGDADDLDKSKQRRQQKVLDTTD